MEFWRDWRDRCLSSPRFQRWALAFPLTRPIARRRARELFDLVAGFIYSQVLSACVELELFARLADGPVAVADLARAVGLPPDALNKLVSAAVPLGLLERRIGGRVGLGPAGGPLAGNAGLCALIRHHARLYRDLQDPVGLLRAAGGGDLAAFWPYARRADPASLEATDVDAYTALMAASQSVIAEQILGSYDFGQHRHLLDVGGGNGEFCRLAGSRHPGLRLTVFDLPAVVASATAGFRDAGMARRTELVAGNFFDTPLPRGADLVTLIRVLHDHEDEAVMRLLRAARAAIADGGVLLVAEQMASTPGAETVGDAYFGFYLLAMGQGRPRTAPELMGLLKQAGFCRLRELPTSLPLQGRVILARPFVG